jgi:hypothetical protein
MAVQNINPEPTPSGWVGWAYFASFLMMTLGVFQAIAGLAAIFKDNYYVVTQSQLLVFNYTTWGWINLILGIVVFMAGLELLRGATWAKIVACFLAVLSLAANMGFLNAYPVWSIIMMVIDVLIIYSLTVHGRELDV